MNTKVSVRYFLLLSGALFWIMLIVASPWASLENPTAGRYLYFFFSGICHQESDRCFHYHGLPLAVCARCLGIYIGFVIGLLGSRFLSGFRRILLAHPRLLLLFVVPMAIDLLLPNNHWSRLLTGIAASFPVAFFVHEAAEQVHITSIRRIFS